MYIAAAIVLILILMFGMRLSISRKAKKNEGKTLEIDSFKGEVAEYLKKEKSLFYFYAPNCSACKRHQPIIDKLQNEFNEIIKIDVSKDLPTARKFGVMATPTIVLMNRNKIKEILIGLRSEALLRSKLSAG